MTRQRSGPMPRPRVAPLTASKMEQSPSQGSTARLWGAAPNSPDTPSTPPRLKEWIH
jgi:hypothetical protein